MRKKILKINANYIFNKISFFYLILGIGILFGCEKKENDLKVEECEDDRKLKSVSIVRCVDAYIGIGDGEVAYIGTHCWSETVGGGTGFGPEWNNNYIPSSFYTPNGYPSSEHSGSGNSGSFSAGTYWYFVFKEIESTYNQNSTLNIMEKQELCAAIDATSTLTTQFDKLN